MAQVRSSNTSAEPESRMERSERIGTLLLHFMKPSDRRRTFLSFKNRILISTLLVLIGCVVMIALVLQIYIFPRLKGDQAVVANLKTLHLVASVIIVAVSWLFIELISKRITSPLRELTKRADQISKEAGRTLERIQEWSSLRDERLESAEPPTGDEIAQLKISFYRMLAHLRASEAHLRESEAKYRFLFNDGPFPLFVLSADDFRIVDVNARAEQEYQYSRDELLGKNFVDLMPPAGRRQQLETFKVLAANEGGPPPVIQQKRRDGSIFMSHVQARLSWFKERPAVIAAVWDVTEKLEQEAMLVQTGKMATLGEMATGIAHELNQPLNVIKIASDFLLKSVRKGHPISHEELSLTAEELGKNVDRAALIIGHLRQFGRKAESTMSPVDINAPIQGAFTLLGTQLNKAGINCQLTLDEHLPRIMGDANRLEQVFINLVINARDAMLQHEREADVERPTRKILTIKSYQENDRIVVIVSDTGPGVPQELRSRIFEPFFTTKKIGEGTGVGLSVSYGIIREHQGTIEVNGQDQEGATFTLTFPALDEALETTHDEDPCH